MLVRERTTLGRLRFEPCADQKWKHPNESIVLASLTATHMDIKGFLMDHVGHFGLPQIGGLVFAVLIAALLGWALGALAARTDGGAARELAVWAATAALAVGFVRSQLPLALALVAIAMFASVGRSEGRQGALRAGALVLGLGCGSGAALVTLVLALPYFVLVRWNARSQASS